MDHRDLPQNLPYSRFGLGKFYGKVVFSPRTSYYINNGYHLIKKLRKKLKKSLLVLAFSVASSGFVTAQNTHLEPIMDRGTLAINGGLSFGWGIGAGGGVEFVLARIDIADVIPLTFGGAGRAYFSSAWGYTFMNLAAVGTAHFGLRGLDLPEGAERWMDPIDLYIGIGIGLGLMDGGYDWVVPGPRLVSPR